MTSRFENNCALWSLAFPKEAIFLPNVPAKPSPESPEEVADWFKQLDISDIKVLCIYGVGSGHAFYAAQDWLKKDKQRYLIFLEDDLSAIRSVLESKTGSDILKNNQTLLFFFSENDLTDPTAQLAELYWHFQTTKILVTALPQYAKSKGQLFKELQHKVLYDATLRESFVEEYLTYGVAFYRNFYPNILHLSGAYLGNNLFGKFNNIPAIICGAGPSLEKHLPQLQALRDRALIFAGGSSMNALNAANLQPHFGAGIDPNQAQYERISKNSAFETPFIFRNRLNHAAYKHLHGPRLYITGSGGYDTADWFEKKLKINGGPIEEGFNIVNFCLELAYAFGCNPIIFIGVDLAFTGMRNYAPGIVPEATVTKTQITHVPEVANQALQKKDIYGKPIYTMWKWIAEAQWIGDFAKKHPETTVINATEGGLGFPKISNQTLKEVRDKYLTTQYDIAGMVHGEIQNSAMQQVTPRKIELAMKELLQSLKRCKKHLRILLDDAAALSKEIRKTRQPPTQMQSGRAILSETELSEEPGYKYVLDIFNKVYTRILLRDVYLLSKKTRTAEWRQYVQRIALNRKKLLFLYKVTLANITLIKYSCREGKKEE